MTTRGWVPLTGELVLRTIDEQSGLTFDGLLDGLGVRNGPGPMALIQALLDLSQASLVAIDGMNSAETGEAVGRNMYDYMWTNNCVWRTTPTWMKTIDALGKPRLGGRQATDGAPILCHPVFGKPRGHLDQADIFVIMPFTAELLPIYKTHLSAVAAELDLSIARSDDFYTTTALTADIWSAIYASALVVADCTGRNPNVFYELGIAHTVGVPVIMISQTASDIPSDLRHLRYYVYDHSVVGLERLRSAVRRAAISSLDGSFLGMVHGR